MRNGLGKLSASRGRSTHDLTLQPTNSPSSHDLTIQPTNSLRTSRRQHRRQIVVAGPDAGQRVGRHVALDEGVAEAVALGGGDEALEVDHALAHVGELLRWRSGAVLEVQ